MNVPSKYVVDDEYRLLLYVPTLRIDKNTHISPLLVPNNTPQTRSRDNSFSLLDEVKENIATSRVDMVASKVINKTSPEASNEIFTSSPTPCILQQHK